MSCHILHQFLHSVGLFAEAKWERGRDSPAQAKEGGVCHGTMSSDCARTLIHCFVLAAFDPKVCSNSPRRGALWCDMCLPRQAHKASGRHSWSSGRSGRGRQCLLRATSTPCRERPRRHSPTGGLRPARVADMARRGLDRGASASRICGALRRAVFRPLLRPIVGRCCGLLERSDGR